MKAISLLQPWASLIASGAKRVETRSWRTHYWGPLAIHASKVLPPGFAALIQDEPFASELRAAGYRVAPNDPAVMPALPCGAILAVVDLVECRLMPGGGEPSWVDELSPEERALGTYAPGRYGWFLTNVRPLPEPLPCRGSLGLWNVPDEVERNIIPTAMRLRCRT